MHTGLAVICRHRGPPARLRRLDPRHRRQHRLRVHPVAQARRPGARPAPGPRAGPLRPARHRAGRRTGPGRSTRRHQGRAGCPVRRAGAGRPAAVRDPDLAAGAGRRRPPGHPARHLDRRNQPRPRAALPGPAAGGPAAGIPARTGPPGEMAVADDARRRTRRPGPHPGAGRCDRRAGPDRGPRRDRRHRRPAPPPHRRPHPAAGRAVVRAAPRHRRPRTPRLHRPDRRGDGRPQGPHRRARRRQCSSVGGQRPRPGPRNIRWTGWSGSSGPPRSAPGGNYPATPTPPTRSAPNPPPPTRTCGLPGTRPWRRSAPSTGPTSAACPTGRCCTCATPTPSKPAGHRSGPARNCARSGSAPPKPAWPPSAPPPKQTPPTATASTKQPPSSRPWRPATRPCTTPTANARPSSPPSWPTGSSGRQATRQQRQLAVAADAELRRRHPGQQFPPLRSAEPEPATQQQRAELTLTAGEEIPQLGQWIADLAAQHRAFAGKLAERQSLMIPAEDPDYEDLGPAFPAWAGPDRDAILQPPKPQIQPSPRILERAAGPRPGHGSRRMTDTASTMETRGGGDGHGRHQHRRREAHRRPAADLDTPITWPTSWNTARPTSPPAPGPTLGNCIRRARLRWSPGGAGFGNGCGRLAAGAA